MKKTFIILFCSCIFSTIQSQTDLYTAYKLASKEAQVLNCASDLLHQKSIEENPLYKQQQIENEIHITNYLQKQSDEKKLNNPIQIPVVFHIIYRGSDTQFLNDDAELEAAVQTLNDGFKGLTVPVFGIDANTPPDLDMEIEFCLASFDPEGNPTTGINRVDGSVIPGFIENGLTYINEDFSIKDLSRWPTAQYLNVWVVYQIQGSTQGAFASFPNGNNYDGVSMTYSNVNSKILVHEVGHWLNLYHVFQGDNNGTQCPQNSDCTTQGDRVCDTPPFMRTECVSNICSSVPEIYNASYSFMGYCSSLISRFTQGQKDRMQAALAGPFRNSLQYSIGCTGIVSTIDNDNDGVSISLDCDDNDPFIPAAVGTPCDDGDATTSNDIILEDGCSCAGTISDCPVSMVYEGDNITIYGLDLVDYAEFTRSSISNNILTCNPPQDNCGPVFILSGIFPNETYTVTYTSENCSESISVFTGTSIPNCNDGIQNQGETDIDCGGPCAPCVTASCNDGIQNQGETGVDCGGPCAPCQTNGCNVSISSSNGSVTITGLTSAENAKLFDASVTSVWECNPWNGSSCANNETVSGFLAGATYFLSVQSNNCSEWIPIVIQGGGTIATCNDGIQNQEETGVDCGGPCTPCFTPTCNDGIQNQGETGVDCGGPCAPCPIESTCNDGIQNQGETDIDCGGPCAPCPTGECNVSVSSANGSVIVTGLTSAENTKLFDTNIDAVWGCNPWNGTPCSNSETITGLTAGATYFLSVQSDECDEWIPVTVQGGTSPTCSDGIQNQGETGVDCGGPCAPCPIEPTCNDGIQNQGETGVDCGGPCMPCPTGGCNVSVSSSNGNVIVTGLTSAENTKLFDSNIATVWGCNPWSGTPCSNSETISGLTAGATYFLSVQSDECDEWIPITIEGGGGFTFDCDLNIDPSQLTVIGTGDPSGNVVDWSPPAASTNCPGGVTVTQISGQVSGSFLTAWVDHIVVYEITDQCGNSEICYNEIFIEGTYGSITCPQDITVNATSNSGAIVNYDLPQISQGTCIIGEPDLISGNNTASGMVFPIGTTTIEFVSFAAGSNTYCQTSRYCSFDITVTNGCPDTDGDGICDEDDCEPNNPGLPLPPGTTCNDMNTNTTNDVIQADGCTCLGTPIGENLPDLLTDDYQPLSGTPGEVIFFTFDLINQGNISTGSYDITSYISTDQTLSSNDIQEGNISTGNTFPGTQQDVTNAITIPSNLAPGNYYLITKIDTNNTIVESNENNNISFTTLTVTGSGGGCNIPTPSGFTALGEFGNSVYFMSNEPDNYTSAKANIFSLGLGGYLASISTQDENDFIFSKLNGNMVIIGLNDSYSEGNLVWDSGEPITFNNLEGTNEAAKDIAVMNFWAGTWNLDHPQAERPYILEIPCNASPRIIPTESTSKLSIENLFPNPTSNEVFATIEVQKEVTVKMTLLNLVGQIMETKTVDLEQGSNTIKVNLGNYSNGIYHLNLSTNSEVITKKIIKVN